MYPSGLASSVMVREGEGGRGGGVLLVVISVQDVLHEENEALQKLSCTY